MDTATLLSGLLFSSIGVGYLIYGVVGVFLSGQRSVADLDNRPGAAGRADHLEKLAVFSG